MINLEYIQSCKDSLFYMAYAGGDLIYVKKKDRVTERLFDHSTYNIRTKEVVWVSGSREISDIFINEKELPAVRKLMFKYELDRLLAEET